MNLLFTSTTAGYVGGVEQHMVLVAQGLSERGHVCSVAYEHASGRDVAEFQTHFAHAYHLADHTLQEVAESLQVDCVYVHKWDHISQILTTFGSSIPIIRMFHDHDIYCPRRHKYLTFSRKICTWKAGIACYFDLAFLSRREGSIEWDPIAPKLLELRRNRKLDWCIVGSSYMKSELMRNGFSVDSILVLPPAVSNFPEPVKALPAQGSILFVGQLVRGKGVDILLRAFSSMQWDGRLDIVGTGNDFSYLQNLAAELGIASRVVFHGWKAHEQLARFYDEALVVAIPSRWPEPFGMVGLEAMQRERPVVATEVGGIPDWLVNGETGILVPVNDYVALGVALQRVVCDHEYARSLALAGRKRVEDIFSFSSYIDRFESLLEGICP